MMVVGVVGAALRGLRVNKLRSALTTLGILIGVAAVILMLAVATGSSAAVAAQIEKLGSNVLNVYSNPYGMGPNPPSEFKELTLDLVKKLDDDARAPHVDSVTPIGWVSGTVTHGAVSSDQVQMIATYPSWFRTTNTKVSAGKYFTNDDVLKSRRVVVIGQSTAAELFPTEDPIGNQLLVGGVPFTVLGILDSQGGGESGFDPNNILLMPLSTAEDQLTGPQPIQQLLIAATSGKDIEVAQNEIRAILDPELGINDKGEGPFYDMYSQTELLGTGQEADNTFTILLAAVAVITLVLGGIGITNIMLVTVTERTREIGIRKALGAPRRAILGQFLIEATLLSLAGGILGVIVGLFGSMFKVGDVDPIVTPISVLLAVGVSIAVGLFFGGYPANRASKLRPIQALRHE